MSEAVAAAERLASAMVEEVLSTPVTAPTSSTPVEQMIAASTSNTGTVASTSVVQTSCAVAHAEIHDPTVTSASQVPGAQTLTTPAQHMPITTSVAPLGQQGRFVHLQFKRLQLMM